MLHFMSTFLHLLITIAEIDHAVGLQTSYKKRRKGKKYLVLRPISVTEDCIVCLVHQNKSALSLQINKIIIYIITSLCIFFFYKHLIWNF